METKNLWPDFPVEVTKSPRAILKEQAGYLMAKTNNVLSADVETVQGNGQIIHQFFVVAPALNNYRYRIFTVSHEVLFYPLVVTWNEVQGGLSEIKIENQQEFLSILSQIFKDTSTTRVISSLLSQSLAE
ncbi:hypothetical protein [Spirosoma pollinicola]|uniref:Uncharacterized protein n=1 Tax=Spirosoma pollinicola TaxID=2057025 RepID=A0A2K8Z4A7_9BACT|nr:hypothetical protein [Spirosoma pollinicola]AUD04702.1 hypothetical protein CWM47_24355 [Spirosoma pollinicola]